MAKIDKDEDIFSEIAAKTGGEILGDLDSVKYFIDSGNLAFNYVCSGKFIDGGIPADKITEIYGPSSSGKSLFASNLLYGCQKLGGFAIILDCENSTNGEFMSRTSHLDLKRVLRYTPMCLEDAFLKIHNVTKEIRKKYPLSPILFVYDSISVSPCKRELKEVDLPDDYKPADWKKIVGGREQPGERAKVCSRELRKLLSVLENQDVTVVIINQTREKIGVLYGSPEVTAGGGNALPFYSSLRLRTQQQKKIENERLETFAGVNVRVKNVKNRTFRPFIVANEVKLYFETGIDPLSGLLSCLLQDEKIDMKSAGNYSVRSDYLPEGKKEYKFKASKARNDIAVQVLIDCPKLVNAKSSKEVEKYLKSFSAAMESSASDDFFEKEVTFNIDGELVEDDNR